MLIIAFTWLMNISHIFACHLNTHTTPYICRFYCSPQHSYNPLHLPVLLLTSTLIQPPTSAGSAAHLNTHTTPYICWFCCSPQHSYNPLHLLVLLLTSTLIQPPTSAGSAAHLNTHTTPYICWFCCSHPAKAVWGLPPVLLSLLCPVRYTNSQGCLGTAVPCQIYTQPRLSGDCCALSDIYTAKAVWGLPPVLQSLLCPVRYTPSQGCVGPASSTAVTAVPWKIYTQPRLSGACCALSDIHTAKAVWGLPPVLLSLLCPVRYTHSQGCLGPASSTAVTAVPCQIYTQPRLPGDCLQYCCHCCALSDRGSVIWL